MWVATYYSADELTVLDESTPLAQFASGEREKLLTELTELRHGGQLVGAHDHFHLLLVMYDARPGCIIGPPESYVGTKEAAKINSMLPHEYFATNHEVGRFLESYEIPYTAFQSVSETVDSERYQVSPNYFISFDDDRLEQLDRALLDEALNEPPTTERHTAIGLFLGYPDRAIEEWCNGDGLREETLFDRLTEQEVIDAIEPIGVVLQEFEVEMTEFAEFVLPYVVPASATECRGQALDDLRRFLAVSLHALAEYDVEILPSLIRDFKSRFSDRA